MDIGIFILLHSYSKGFNPVFPIVTYLYKNLNQISFITIRKYLPKFVKNIKFLLILLTKIGTKINLKN